MSIYSANRTGSMNTGTIVANESYGMNDIGRILYESECNNQLIFEAILATDFHEIHGLREGTLLEAEVEEVNKKSKESLIKRLKDLLDAFWARIKGVFKSAIQKFSAYILRDGRAFAKEFEARRKTWKKDYDGSIQARMLKDDFEIKLPDGKDFKDSIYDRIAGQNLEMTDVVNDMLGKRVGNEPCTVKEYAVKFLDKALTYRTVKEDDIDKMLKVISDASLTVKNLKQQESDAEKAIANVKKTLEDWGKTEEDTKKVTVLVSACQTVVSVMTRCYIQLNFKIVRSYRSTLAKINSTCLRESAMMIESAALDAADEVDFAFSDEAPAPDDDTQKDIDTVVAAAEADCNC